MGFSNNYLFSKHSNFPQNIYIMLLITIWGGGGGGFWGRYTQPMTKFIKLFNIVDENDFFNLKLFWSHHMSHFSPIITISLSIIIK
jgi:hypothetical protein